jgi:DNA-directed RNA polymerase subunit K/omega
MRSELVFGAMTNVPNRYHLAMLASKAARALHKTGTRMQDTANDVLTRFSHSNPIASERALREPLVGPPRPKMKLPVTPHKSKDVMIPLASEGSTALWEAARVLNV